MDRLALSRVRNRPAADRLERLPADRGGQPLHRATERRSDPRFHRSDAEIVRRLHLAAASLRRAGEHAIQGPQYPGLVEAVVPASRAPGVANTPSLSGKL